MYVRGYRLVRWADRLLSTHPFGVRTRRVLRRVWRKRLRRSLTAIVDRCQRRPAEDDFTYELSVAAIFRNEARYLDEWLHFHEGVGVDHFYLYDDESRDDFAAVLEPWVSSGKVTLIRTRGENQMEAYNDCIRRFAYESRWIAFIDLDEFLFSPKAADLKQVLRSYQDLPAVFVNWVLFGSSGHVARPDGYVIDAYTQCLGLEAAGSEVFDHGSPGTSSYVTGWSRDGKSIVNPRSVIEMGVHRPRELKWGEVLDENRRPAERRGGPRVLTCDSLRINHYWSRSLEELHEKVSKESVFDRSRPPGAPEAWLRREACLNETRDETIQPIWAAIKNARGL